MRFEPALSPLLTWPSAAVIGWALAASVVLWAPLVLAALAVSGILLWRTGQRPVQRVAAPARSGEHLGSLVAHSA